MKPTRHRAVIDRLVEFIRRLEVLYSNCVTAQAALRGQNAEQDIDMARFLRHGVSEPLTSRIEDIGTLIVRLGGNRPEPPEEME